MKRRKQRQVAATSGKRFQMSIDSMDAIQREQLRTALWQQPIVGGREAAFMLRLPYSTFNTSKLGTNHPPRTMVGRRERYSVVDLKKHIGV